MKAQNHRRRMGGGDIAFPCRRLVGCSAADGKIGAHPRKTMYSPPAAPRHHSILRLSSASISSCFVRNLSIPWISATNPVHT